MTAYVDEKFIRLLQPKLKLFKQKGPHLWNFRCPCCGDSQKNSVKARGYIYARGDNYSYSCHNCSASMRLDKFIKIVDPVLYGEYQLEKFTRDKPVQVRVEDYMTSPKFDNLIKEIPRPVRKINLDYATPIENLSRDFYARKYLVNRRIPTDGLYFTSDFSEFVKNQFPKEDKVLYKEPRIIIPFYDRKGKLLGVQGRALGESKLKYITIKEHEEFPKIFGWEKLILDDPVYVVEGPFDSLFLENCVATMDASLFNIVNILSVDLDYTFVYDNEPRNKQIVNNMKTTIERGFKICIWPSDIKEKDINEMILSGKDRAVIQHLIDNNTYQGIKAKMHLNLWSKV